MAATGGANARGQLTGESNPRVSGGGSFDYDNAGNPTTFRGVPQASPTADNQPGGNTYDGNGSPTTYNGLTYTYDAERRLTSIPGKAAFSAGYRADGLRAWKSAQQTAPLGQSHAATQTIRYTPPVTYFLYDGDTIIAELDKNGAATAVNTWGPTGLLARQIVSGTNAGTSSVYTYDPSGNVAQRLDGSGNVQGSYAFDAFGREATNDTAPDPYQYGGKWGYYSDSETGLVLCGHRYYDSSNGRWLTRDPISYDGGINLYSYVGNSPASHIDWSGYEGEEGENGGDTIEPIGTIGPSEATTSGMLDAEQEGADSPAAAREIIARNQPNGGGFGDYPSEYVHGPYNEASNPTPATASETLVCPSNASRTPGDDLPRGKGGSWYAPDPNAEGAHTVIGTRTNPKESPEPYRQGMTYDSNGNCLGRTDVSDHGTPHHHAPVHFHPWNGTKPGNPSIPVDPNAPPTIGKL